MTRLMHRDITFDDYLPLCAQIVRYQTQMSAPMSVLALMARRGTRKDGEWSSHLAQAHASPRA